MVRVFINVRSVYQTLFLALLEPASCTLRGISRLLLEELLTPWRVICAARSNITSTIAHRRNSPLSDAFTHGTSRRSGRYGHLSVSCPPSAAIGLIWWDSTWVVLGRDGVSRAWVEASLYGVRHIFLGKSFQIQIHVRRPIGRLVLVLSIYTSHRVVCQMQRVSIRTTMNTLTTIFSHYNAFLLLDSSRLDVILMKNCDSRKSLPWSAIALGPSRASFFKGTLNHFFIVHLEAWIAASLALVICYSWGWVESRVGIQIAAMPSQNVSRMTLHALSPLVEDSKVRTVICRLKCASARVRPDMRGSLELDSAGGHFAQGAVGLIWNVNMKARVNTRAHAIIKLSGWPIFTKVSYTSLLFEKT